MDFEDVAPPPYSDEDLARRFADRHGHEFRYVSGRKRWLRWDGARWAEDETELVLARVGAICREAAGEMADEKRAVAQARSLCSNKTVLSVERMASRLPGIATAVDDLDRFISIIATPDGLLTMPTGALEAPDPAYLLTRITAVGPQGGDGTCEAWLRVLDQWTGADSELIAYLQRIAGYCLSGEMGERAVFILFGPRNDGAAMFLETLVRIMGDYSMTLPMEAFLASGNERHPADIANTRGRRLVVATQAEQEAKWNLSRLLEMTGGGRIAARYMYSDWFEFAPTAKLAFRAVHLPSIKGATEDVRRLFHVVPFPGAVKRDRALWDTLWHERQAILRWAVEGYQAYRSEGLSPPPAAVEATDAYIAVADAFTAWLAACCERDATAVTGSTDLWRSWSRWCSINREDPKYHRWLSNSLMEHGFERDRTMRGSVYSGIRLTATP